MRPAKAASWSPTATTWWSRQYWSARSSTANLDETRVPRNCLDVLAQQVVGAVAADPWDADALFYLCRRAYPFRALDRADYDRVLGMLSGDIRLEMDYAPYPKITWDKVNGVLYPEPSARMIAFRSGGTIPDISEYDVYFEARKTVVGRLGEAFVEELHGGDVFILGNASWRVVRIHRNRVIVEDVYGLAPTIPFWFGDRPSRTFELGLMVGAFRREIAEMMAQADAPDEAIVDHLQIRYHTNKNGARAIREYFTEQRFVTGEIPSDRCLLVEHFRDELGQLQVVIHTPFGIRVHDPWAMALAQAFDERYGARPVTATVDDGMLLSFSKDAEEAIGHVPVDEVVGMVTPDSLDGLLVRALRDSPIFKSRFRHNAVRSLMVLREYKGRRTPVWMQGLRSSGLLEACQELEDYPLIKETLRECTHEALDVPNLRRVLEALSQGEIETNVLKTRIPSPFTHSLLLLGQYGELGSIPTEERRGRLMHLHRELLRQILDEETLRHLLNEDVVKEVEERLQWRGVRRARSLNELARLLGDLGDLVLASDQELSLGDRVSGAPMGLLDELIEQRRAVLVPIPTAETHSDRWIATEAYPLYRAAFEVVSSADPEDEALLRMLRENGPLTLSDLPLDGDGEVRLGRLVRAYEVLRVVRDWRPAYVAADRWLPRHIHDQVMTRQAARLELVRKFARAHGPFTKYEVMERYGFTGDWVEEALVTLRDEDFLVRGEYVATKSFPQWCYRPNLEEIHRLTLQRLRKEMEPASPEAYADFLVRWQHLHPETRLEGLEGLRAVIAQLQGQDNYQIVYERDVFHGRIKDYDPAMLDQLCQTGEVVWRRFGYTPWSVKRGQIGFCFRRDQSWVTADPNQVEMDFRQWDDDIPEECDAVRGYLVGHGASYFDDIVAGTKLDWRLVLRATWHLVWTGEATNDSYESIRYADVASGLSGCYDLATRPTKKGVTLDFIVRHMLENKRLDPRLGRWAPTERLIPPAAKPAGSPAPDAIDPEEATAQLADLLLHRHGFITRETVKLKLERNDLSWRDLRRALVKRELLGTVRRGYFVEGLSGEQYALPEAVTALQQAKLRQLDRLENGGDPTDVSAKDGLVLINLYDPANPYGPLFPITDEVGNEIKQMSTPTKYLILRDGQPLVLYDGRVTILGDVTRELTIAALRLLMDLVDHPAVTDSRRDIQVGQWNFHPIAASPGRHLLTTLGFVPTANRWRGYIYNGVDRPEPEAVVAAQAELLDVYERVGKEAAPIVYDAAWVISQSHETIRPKVEELIDWLRARVPPECEFIYRPRYFKDFQILYRGMRCINPYVQTKQIRLQIAHKGWTPGIVIGPDTDLDDEAFTNGIQGAVRANVYAD